MTPAMPPPIFSLRDISVRFGAEPLFSGVDLTLGPDDRLCLVGRNGGGKSTLLGLIAGDGDPDHGERWARPGLRIGHLAQAVDFGDFSTVAAYVAGGAIPAPPHQIEAALAPLGLAPERRLDTLSGGEARRAGLAAALVGEPELLLLDEPTNDLDLPAIEWLEARLAAFRGAVVMISHDRALLARIARRTAWLDRGILRVAERGFEGFEDWRAEVADDEARTRARLDQKLAVEQAWLHKGVTARRRRNQGRLRALQALRAERRAARTPTGTVKLSLGAAETGGRVVIDADSLAKAYDGRAVVDALSIRIMRGDRVAFTGPNGAGKTTALRLLTGELAADGGTLGLGTGLQVVTFDQGRSALDPAATLWETLCPAGGDTVTVHGRPKHVVGFLSDFLFAESQAKSPVSSLSGGEKARLLLAMLFARPSNLLVLDEPTNDLDLETLDLLQEVLSDYDGTVLMVSHDRDFIDRLATTTIWMAGDGTADIHVGGWTDMARTRGTPVAAISATRAAKAKPAKPKSARQKLGYKDQRELESLPAQIADFAAVIAAHEADLADPDFYTRDRAAFDAIGAELSAARAALATAEERWLALAERDEALRAGAALDGDAADQ